MFIQTFRSNSLFAIAALLFAVNARAETCPWMNAATAGGLLGGGVTALVTHESANRDDMGCSFSMKQQDIASELRISVRTMETPRSEFTSHAAACGSRTEPLRAIGNEAVVCDIDEDGKNKTAQVVGRVRNRIFTIVLSTADPTVSPATLREKVRAAAEQVAGNLF